MKMRIIFTHYLVYVGDDIEDLTVSVEMENAQPVSVDISRDGAFFCDSYTTPAAPPRRGDGV